MRTRRRPPRRTILHAVLASMATTLSGLAVLGTPAPAQAVDCAAQGPSVICLFTYTGQAQTWTVPAGVTTATFEVIGAAGGVGETGMVGGVGGGVRATIGVTPGSVFQVNVGGKGTPAGGGWNGGGNGVSPVNPGPGGGGGASDVRVAPYSLANRLLVGGGGGGGGTNRFGAVGTPYPGRGGDGGGTIVGTGGVGPGNPGQNSSNSVYTSGGGSPGSTARGGGGTPSQGSIWPECGFFTTAYPSHGDPGIDGAGRGGAGGRLVNTNGSNCLNMGGWGGGGGGGYQGGGGGGAGVSAGAGGGGGSGFGPAGAANLAGLIGAHGSVKITYLATSSDWTVAPDITVTSSVTLSTRAPGIQDLFYVNLSGQVAHHTIESGVVGSQELLPNTDGKNTLRFVGAPVGAVSWDRNRIDVFAIIWGGQLMHAWWDGVRWSNWEVSGEDMGAPSVASWAPGQLTVIANQPNNGKVVRRTFDERGWSTWKVIGTFRLAWPIVTTATSAAPGEVDVVSVTDWRYRDGLQHATYAGGGWSTWNAVPDTVGSGVAALTSVNGTVSLYFRDVPGTGPTVISRIDRLPSGWGPKRVIAAPPSFGSVPILAAASLASGVDLLVTSDAEDRLLIKVQPR